MRQQFSSSAPWQTSLRIYREIEKEGNSSELMPKKRPAKGKRQHPPPFSSSKLLSRAPTIPVSPRDAGRPPTPLDGLKNGHPSQIFLLFVDSPSFSRQFRLTLFLGPITSTGGNSQRQWYRNYGRGWRWNCFCWYFLSILHWKNCLVSISFSSVEN